MGHYYSEMYALPQISKEELKRRERLKKAKNKLIKLLDLNSEDELREFIHLMIK